MPDINTRLTRQELYELAWTKPATHIAKDFGVQLAAVLKACDILNVPRPTTGHWAKLEHGKAPPRPPLPVQQPGAPESTTFSERRPRLKGAIKAPPTPANSPIATEPETIKWHFAVQKTRAAYRGGDTDRKYGTLQRKSAHPCLWISVTRSSLDRSLLILNRLAVLLEANGFTFVMPAKADEKIKLVYTTTDTALDFHIKEDVERYERELKPEEKGKDPLYIWNRWLYRATGRLRLVITEFHPEGARKSWGDGKNTKLEDKLADAAPDFVICAQGKHAHDLEMKAWHLRYEEQERLRRETEAKAREEKERRDVLISAARRWKDAGELMGFREACEVRLRSTTPDGSLTKLQTSWLAWVDGVIRDTNPLTSGFLKRLEQPEAPLPGE